MRYSKKNTALWVLAIATVLVVAFICYSRFFSPTKVALVNFPNYQTASIAKSNSNSFIKVKDVALDELDELSSYDAVLIFGMGLNITAEQRASIQAMAADGLPIYSMATTNPDNNICSIDSLKAKQIGEYMGGGGSKNYSNMLEYIRRNIDGKTFFSKEPQPADESPSDVLYNVVNESTYSTVEEYEKAYKECGLLKADAPKLAVVCGNMSPFSGNDAHIDSLISGFQQAGYNVYPIFSFAKRLDFLKEINPNAVVYLPHGRMVMGNADAAATWLKERNIPMFCPLTIMRPESEWIADKMGMAGGFLSQSVVTPELDGGILPFVVNAQYVDENGYYIFRAIPERLKEFIQTVSAYVNLRTKANSEKRVAIYYFKGVGQSTMVASGMETMPSLYNFIKRLQAEGYTVKNLPTTVEGFQQLIMTQGAVLGTYADGAFDSFLANGNPALVEKVDYESWVNQKLSPESYAAVTANYGDFPGSYMALEKDGKQLLAVARIDLGNVVLLPQPMPGIGDNGFQLVHGAKTAPPHTYIASYLWTQYGFKADALVHFGTHGSLEFTPEKQVALSSLDWSDRLVGSLPHFYLYTIGNVGEGVIAKRRAYATLVSYLTPPFMESNTRSQYKELENQIEEYHKCADNVKDKQSLVVKRKTVALGLHRDLGIDSVLSKPYTEAEVERVENFVEEIANERMLGAAYILGVPYKKAKIQSSVLAMSADPIAYSLSQLDRLHGKTSDAQLKSKPYFTQRYLNPAKVLVQQLLSGSKKTSDELVCSLAGISTTELAMARTITAKPVRGAKPNAEKIEPTKEEKQLAFAVAELERTLANVTNYERYLQQSPEAELSSLVNALNGGYIAPSAGGDPIANPNTLPTGRNLYSINAEATPSEAAWNKGVALATQTIEQYKTKHGEYPKKVSYTLWSSEFIETEGATIAQVLYMLGVEPVRDAYGRINDLKLIPSETLGRPRIDVVVQTSGQLRDIAASRLFLINRAVEMAAAAGNSEANPNFVANGTVEAERLLVEDGMSPQDARDMSTARVFGGVNGGYGTGITGMVESGDRWEKESEIAETYINNMGAVYGSEKLWGEHRKQVFKAMLHSTDVVVQPRQSNTWGALSLDHVYEFMGGMNLAVRNVTGKDPDAYFSDYRNRNNVRMQELKEAIGVESRTTLFNPNYIKEQMSGGASAAGGFSELFHNTYGWNVMKPDVIDNEFWDKLYSVYVKDEYALNMRQFFEQKNPAALQEMTGVMLETARKGMWKATDQQLSDIAQLHTDLVKEYGAAGSAFLSTNAKLQDFIAQKSSPENAEQYKQQLQKMKEANASSATNKDGVVMKKDSTYEGDNGEKSNLNGILVVSVVLAIFVALLVILRKRRKK